MANNLHDFYSLDVAFKALNESDPLNFSSTRDISILERKGTLTLSVVATKPYLVELDKHVELERLKAEQRKTKIESPEAKRIRLAEIRKQIDELGYGLIETGSINGLSEPIRTIGNKSKGSSLLIDINDIEPETGNIVIYVNYTKYYLIVNGSLCTLSNSTIGFRGDELNRLLPTKQGNQEPKKKELVPEKGNTQSMRAWVKQEVENKYLDDDGNIKRLTQKALIDASKKYSFKDGSQVKTAWSKLEYKTGKPPKQQKNT